MEHTHMIEERLAESIRTISSLGEQSDELSRLLDMLIERLRNGFTIWTAGNGGSAAQALHFSEELVGRYRADRRPLASSTLCADVTTMSCIANDFGFDAVFARPFTAMASPGDVLLVLSTSGKSRNIVAALEAAKELGCMTVGLLGNDGGKCLPLCEHAVVVDATDSAIVQDAHQVVIHLLCEGIERWAASHYKQEVSP